VAASRVWCGVTAARQPEPFKRRREKGCIVTIVRQQTARVPARHADAFCFGILDVCNCI
jgi:hypothetical protein